MEKYIVNLSLKEKLLIKEYVIRIGCDNGKRNIIKLIELKISHLGIKTRIFNNKI